MDKELKIEVPIGNPEQFFADMGKSVKRFCEEYKERLIGFRVTEKGIEPVLTTTEPAKGYWIIGNASPQSIRWLADMTERVGGPFNLVLNEQQFGGKVEWVSLDPRYPSMKHQTQKPPWIVRLFVWFKRLVSGGAA